MNSQAHILIADEVHPSLMPMLAAIGCTFQYLPGIGREELKQQLGVYHGLVIRSKTTVDADLLQHATQLRFIARAGAGLDLFDLHELKSRNIAVFAANEGNRDAVAEHVLGMILCLFNKIHLADAQVRQGIWQREANRGIELMGKTWGIIGYGNNGRATAQRLTGFGVKVLGHDIDPHKKSDEYASLVPMAQLYDQADIISLHIPLSAESYKMVDFDFLNQFKKNIYLANTARGEIVVLQDLLHALTHGRVLGACLDVLENEKISKLSATEQAIFNALCQLPNVLFSPHVAGWTVESYIKINEVMVQKIKSLL